MYDWMVIKVESRTELETNLNSLTRTGWEIFQIIPTLAFREQKIMMVTVPMPSEIQYEIVARKKKEPDVKDLG